MFHITTSSLFRKLVFIEYLSEYIQENLVRLEAQLATQLPINFLSTFSSCRVLLKFTSLFSVFHIKWTSPVHRVFLYIRNQGTLCAQ